MGLMDRDYMHRERPRSGHRLSPNPSNGSPWKGTLWQIAGWGVLICIVFAVIKALPFGRFGNGAGMTSGLLASRQVMPFPASGDAIWYVAQTQPAVAPLTLAAPMGTDRNFVVRLDDWETRAPQVLIPIRAGETSVTLLPLGRYRLKIASGTNWQGTDRLFGPQSQVKEAVYPVDFTRQGNQTMGRRTRATLKPSLPASD